MTLNYDVTTDDFIAFNLYHFRHSSALQRQVLIMRIALTLLVIVLTVLLIYLLDRDKQFSPVAFLGPLIGGVVFFLIYPRLIEPNLRKQIQKMLREGKNDGTIGKQTLMLSPEGIVNSTSAGEQKMFWPSVERIAETPEHVFVYVSAVSAAIIPTRTFKDADERATFLRTLQQYYGQATGRTLPTN